MPIIIYQMGKVGSVSVKGYLEQQGLNPLHAHYIANISGEYTSARHHNMKKLFTKGSGEWKIITLVRDPIERNLSAFMWSKRSIKKTAPKYNFSQFKHQFINNYYHEWALNWFDFEFKKLLGVDIYKHFFFPELGYSIFPTKIVVDNVKLHGKVLVIRTEDLTTKGPTALSKFLGVLPKEFPKENKTDFWFYDMFKKDLQLPEPFVKRVYSSQLVQHFYSPEEIEELTLKWTTDYMPA